MINFGVFAYVGRRGGCYYFLNQHRRILYFRGIGSEFRFLGVFRKMNILEYGDFCVYLGGGGGGWLYF